MEYKNTLSAEDYNFLRGSVGWKELNRTQVQKGIDNSAYIITAVRDGRTVGMARLISDGGCAGIIVDVVVLPACQGMGIGKRMFRSILDFVESSLGEGESIMLNLMSAKGKEEFYEKFGFIKRPNGTQGCGMIKWVRK